MLAGEQTSADVSRLVQRYVAFVQDSSGAIARRHSFASPTAPSRTLERDLNKYLTDLARSDPDSFRYLAMTWGILAFPEDMLRLGFDEVRFDSSLQQPDYFSDDLMREWRRNRSVGVPLADAITDMVDSLFHIDVNRVLHELYRPESAATLDPLRLLFESPLGVQYRTPGGAWLSILGVADQLMGPGNLDEEAPMGEWVDRIAANAQRAIQKSNPHSFSGAILLPSLFYGQDSSEPVVAGAARGVLRQLHEQEVSLSALGWRTLEEIVAELLHDMGLTVAVTKRSWDGGRDVIARGELIPGEPTLLAVEVKHRPIVGVRDLRQALWANRRFPALLFATSGRFEAGVFREHSGGDNRLRLVLKDGVGLSQWIDGYAARRGWRV